MNGKPVGALLTLAVVWNGEMTAEPHAGQLFATRKRDGTLGGVFRTVAIAGGPRYYRITAIKVDPESYDGPFDWELYWFSRSPT